MISALHVNQAGLPWLILISVLSLPLGAADVCDPGQVQGPFGFQLSGETTISGSSKPVASLGRLIFDGEGGLSGYSSVMFDGLLLGNPVTGTYEVRSDCNMSWSLQDDSGAFQHFSGVVTPGGKKLRFRQTDPGGAQRGIAARTSNQCSTLDLQKKYVFTLSGSSIPMLPGEVSTSVAAKGLIAADESGNFKLTLGDLSGVVTDVTAAVETDCIVHLELALPAGETTRLMKLRGILISDGKEILAIQIDPGSMVSAQFTARQ